MISRTYPLVFLLLAALCCYANDKINRRNIVSRYNPKRTTITSTTPMQVGNGNFAFGADITGLQTFQPFSIMSSWGWNNDSLPPGRTEADVLKYHGQSWYNHGRLVEYDFGGGDDEIEMWLRSNPNRVNLGRIGLVFVDNRYPEMIQEVVESDLESKQQYLDLWTGVIHSSFHWKGELIRIRTFCHQVEDTIGIQVYSRLLNSGELSLFLDFPWNDGDSKFSAPFVGKWDRTGDHTTQLYRDHNINNAYISHSQSSSTSLTTITGDPYSISRDSPTTHRYTIKPKLHASSFSLTINFSPEDAILTTISPSTDEPRHVLASSKRQWKDYWTQSGFVDVYTGSTDPRADELQRRIILSRYLMRVNEAGDTPPQESGLVNNGWFGKFHMEMYFWHSAQWALWNNWDLLDRSSSIYSRFLSSSIERAQVQQGWSSGARWPKMTDPTGASAPGELNNLLIWQQPHPLIFAQYEYRSSKDKPTTLKKWEHVVKATADWMSNFAWYNESTGVYDLGPPMHVVSEDTQPNSTQNPAFELAYWRLGLGWAEDWIKQLGEDIPPLWTDVKNGLAPLPLNEDDGTYAVYEGISSDFWTDEHYINDHPALVGLYGWLPPSEGLDVMAAKVTADKVWTHWNLTNCWGWDFPMLAMSAARNGETQNAIGWLLDPLFQFDDVGMPEGGVRVPTPYFPSSGALLYAIAMMAEGWDGSEGRAPGFPKNGWNVRAEGLAQAL